MAVLAADCRVEQKIMMGFLAECFVMMLGNLRMVNLEHGQLSYSVDQGEGLLGKADAIESELARACLVAIDDFLKSHRAKVVPKTLSMSR